MQLVLKDKSIVFALLWIYRIQLTYFSSHFPNGLKSPSTNCVGPGISGKSSNRMARSHPKKDKEIKAIFSFFLPFPIFDHSNNMIQMTTKLIPTIDPHFTLSSPHLLELTQAL